MAKRHLFKVRFKINGKPRTFKTVAKSPHEAAAKLKTKSATILSVTKVPQKT